MTPSSRQFDMMELAFFAVHRKWCRIVERFGDGSDVRDAIISSDEDGGLGFLRWYPATMSWVLTDKGKRWVEPRRIAKALREWPEVKPEADTQVSVDVAEVVTEKPRSFLCIFCGTRSIGATSCQDADCTNSPQNS